MGQEKDITEKMLEAYRAAQIAGLVFCTATTQGLRAAQIAGFVL